MNDVGLTLGFVNATAYVGFFLLSTAIVVGTIGHGIRQGIRRLISRFSSPMEV